MRKRVRLAGPDPQTWRCKKCLSELNVVAVQRERKLNPDKYKALNKEIAFKRRGITKADYDKMFDAQGGLCAVCAGPPGGPHARRFRFQVDHDHESGQIRGLLCNKCNFVLGLCKDSPARLLKLAAYLFRARELELTA
jgi:hypothetical protein